MSAPVETATRKPLQMADGFALALDDLMACTVQGDSPSRSVPEIVALPGLVHFQATTAQPVARHSTLIATLRHAGLVLFACLSVPEDPKGSFPMDSGCAKPVLGLQGAGILSNARPFLPAPTIKTFFRVGTLPYPFFLDAIISQREGPVGEDVKVPVARQLCARLLGEPLP